MSLDLFSVGRQGWYVENAAHGLLFWVHIREVKCELMPIREDHKKIGKMAAFYLFDWF